MRATLRRCMPPGITSNRGPLHFHDPRYPITEALTEVFGGYRSQHSERRMPLKKGQDKTPGKRAEVVSEQLCDDIIGYLAPSLEAYKGCTIIDVHPGACLWSSKLHDFLKPKRHVLMEPELRYFDPFVKPLLDQPESTYRHTTLVGAHAREYWGNYTTLLDDQSLIPDRPGLMPDDPKLREIDTSILFTGNLWRKYPVEYRTRYVDFTTLVIQHMTYAALTNDIFHRSGLVRMLWWAPDSVKQQVLPGNVRAKRSYDSALQMGASITEVAGVSHVETVKRKQTSESPRATEFDATVQSRVERRMADNGLKIPPGRQMPKITRAAKDEDGVNSLDSIFKTTCTNIVELNAAIETHDAWIEYMAVELPKIKQPKGPAAKVSAMTDEIFNEMLKKLVRFQQSIDAVNSRISSGIVGRNNSSQARTIITVDLAIRLINLEANYAAVRDTKPDADSLAAATQAVLRSSKTTTKLIEDGAGVAKVELINILLDDLMSCEAQPPTLHRDRRPYEPLQAHPHEFWPRYELTLLDMVPNTADLSVSEIADRSEGAKVCQELLKHLYHSPALSLKTALERLAPNAAQDLIPEVPALTDARKGGRMDSSKMPVRMLTQEMVDGLVRAFLEWPFRPSSVEMELAQMGEIDGEGEELELAQEES